MLSKEKIKKTSMFLRAWNHPLRLKIIDYLDRHHTANVTDMMIYMRCEQPLISAHLAILRRQGFVYTEKQEKYIYYSLNRQRHSDMNEFLRGLHPNVVPAKRNTTLRDLLRSIKDKNKHKLFCLVCEEPGLSVSELSLKMNLHQSIISLMLKDMLRSNLVYKEPIGKWREYYPNVDEIRKLSNAIDVLFAK